MKKIGLLSLVAGALIMASCNNASTNSSNNTDSTSVVDDHAGHNHDHDHAGHDHAAGDGVGRAEEASPTAKGALEAAVAKGDKNADQGAGKSVEDTKYGWAKVKDPA